MIKRPCGRRLRVCLSIVVNLLAMLLAASQALRDSIGAPIPSPDVPRFRAATDAVRLALGDDKYTAAWNAGRALAVADAIALAVAAYDS